MADRLTPEQRRRCMQANRGSDTSPELRLRKALHAMGFRYALRSDLPGRPDVVFSSRKIALFIDGCFWHMCPKHFVIPGENRDKWMTKLRRNVERDRAADKELAQLGWKVVRVWEHEIRHDLIGTAHRISKILARH